MNTAGNLAPAVLVIGLQAALAVPAWADPLTHGAGSARQVAKPRKAAKLLHAVEPSAELEARVEEETARALRILESLGPDNVLDSPYLVSAVYYRDGFLTDYPDERPDGAPARRIIARISRQLSEDKKRRFIQLLSHRCGKGSEPQAPQPLHYPVEGGQIGNRRWPRAHRYAVDIFARDGAAVYAATGGVVVLAESGWQPGDPFSTSSYSGGNSIIVFDPQTARFCRYGHLDRVLVRVGEMVSPGQQMGTVGRSGANAARRGHGNHLHFEINRFTGAGTQPLTAIELRTLLHGGLRKM